MPQLAIIPVSQVPVTSAPKCMLIAMAPKSSSALLALPAFPLGCFLLWDPSAQVPTFTEHARLFFLESFNPH